MCFVPTPRAEYSSKDVFNLLIAEEEQIKVENHLRIVNGFFQLLLEQAKPELVEENH